MNPNSEKPSFLDRGTLIAFAIIMLFWFAWSKYVETKYPQVSAVSQSTPQVTEARGVGEKSTPEGAPEGEGAARNGAPPSQEASQPSGLGALPPSDEQILVYEDDRWRFEISSFGMGVRAIDVKTYQTRDNQPIILGDVKGAYPFSTRLINELHPIPFTLEQSDARTFIGRAEVGDLKIQKTMVVNPTTYTIDTKIEMNGAPSGTKGLTTVLNDHLLEGDAGSIFAPSYDFSSWYLRHDDTKTRQMILKSEGGTVDAKNVSIASLSAHYFALAILDRSNILPRFSAKVAPKADNAMGELVYEFPSNSETMTIEYVAFAGPKSFDLLSQVDPKLTEVIDYGMFAGVAKPILHLLKYIYSVFENWGWSIVVLTIIVRLLVLPFNLYSYKSMKVMQKIQPEMNRIRERFKDKTSVEDRAKLNQEIMDLMRRNKANPLGGCLPMLLQLPVFIALYQVLGQSIELYRAPFAFWIHDLSVKDPFYVLPVLMGVSMFVQQKITPTTMDPAQAKILLWMPVIFSLFMIGLPSGLTLYIFVSTLFAIIQQYIFMRDSSSIQMASEAKA